MDCSNKFKPLFIEELGISKMLASHKIEDSESPPKRHEPFPIRDSETIKPRKLGVKATRFVQSLPKTVHKQVALLLDIQTQKRRLKEDYQKELLALEKKYLGQYGPLYAERARIVSGANLGCKEEIDMEGFRGPIAGVPEFWRVVMQHHVAVSDLIHHEDKEALSYLTDIRLEYLKPLELGFRLLFDFAKNPFFSNETLSKTYTYETGDDGAGLFYGEVRGDTIYWKPGMELPQLWEGRELL
jgi:nucleosome assembly protein 1-like 1